MRAVRITVLVAAAMLATAAPIASGGVASASAAHHVKPALYDAHDEGFGATLAAAEQDAKIRIQGDYGPCEAPFNIYAYGQSSTGSWWAKVSAECSSFG